MKRAQIAAASSSSSNSVSILPPLPTPYEYALISTAIYSDVLIIGMEDGVPVSEEHKQLREKGWRVEKLFTPEDDYRGGIWINDEQQQIVIAHRGSRNITSWVTDIESVIQLKPGNFVSDAIGTLQDPIVKEYRERGYRLSTTGHSLGGFLAQICVFWSQRQEFEDTYYPPMSAMVFDSPGALDFLEILQTNLSREKSRIKLEHLNVHNFCAMPTLVSTFGTQVGTIWHLSGAEEVKFDFVNDHRMEHMLSGFSSETGQPLHFRQMLDWPQADYSDYENISSTMSHFIHVTVKAPFDLLNACYKKLKAITGFARTPTWYDQLFHREGEVSYYLHETENVGHRPTPETLAEKLDIAVRGHYSTFSTEETSKKRIDIHHFDLPVQQFLWDLDLANQLQIKLGWKEKLQALYQGDYSLLQQYQIKKQGDKIEVVILDEFAGSMFDFQNKLLVTLRVHGVIFFTPFIVGCLEESREAIQTLQNDSTKETLTEKIKNLEALLTGLTQASTPPPQQVHLHAPVLANVQDALAIGFVAEYNPNFIKDIIATLTSSPSHGSIITSGAILATQPGGVAIRLPRNPTSQEVAALMQLSTTWKKTASFPSEVTCQSANSGAQATHSTDQSLKF